MTFKCPNCKVKYYSRVRRQCYACGVALPVELLFPESEIRRYEERMKREKQAMREEDKNINASGPDVNAIGGALLS